MFRRGLWFKSFTLVAVEAGIIFTAVLLSLYLRFPQRYSSVLVEQRGIYKVAFTTFICQSLFYLFDLYDVSKPRLRRELMVDLFQAVGATMCVLGGIFMLRPTLVLGYLQEVEGGGVERYGNGVPVIAMVLALVVMICWRLCIHWLMRSARLGERLLIVGADKLAIEVASEALARRDLGYKVVGFIAEDPRLVGQQILNPKVIGVVGELSRIVEEQNIDRVVVALQDRRGHMPVDQLLQIRLQNRAAIEEGTSLYERLTGRVSVETRPSWLIFSGGAKHSTVWSAVRRVFNFTLALVGIILSLPVSIIAAIAIKLESPGPIFYQQERVGKNDRIFKIIKFRSMRQDAEKDGTPQWAQQHDPRITRVGRFLRKTRIDEIPQFINILRGEMSFVGPRAERHYFVEQLNRQIPFYSQRHLVEPGLTGWAQVSYGYGSTVEDAIQKLQYDLYYIKNFSLLFDLWIMFKTIKIVMFGYGR